ncbi:uncharacterized protein LOC142750231 isoform X2 [Rhinoderma darwinii]|uniref:uncharacterized protein LOC142750231 isoform X2 n=1 Tax=Rhinoderma darwinii TaxID=43563 RepID=UPI003F67DF60
MEDTEACEKDREKRYTVLFNQLDANKDGHVDINELREGLAAMGMKACNNAEQVHNRAELWDTSSAGCSERNTRDEGYVGRGLYPEGDGMLESEQGVMENDVRDRFRKQLAKKPQSGSSPERRTAIAHLEEPAFLIPSRELPPSRGNVPPRPQQLRGLAQVQQQAEGPSPQKVVGEMQAEDMAEEDVAQESTQATASPVGRTCPAPPAVAPRRKQRRRGGRKRAQTPKTANTVESQALTMIRRVQAEDDFHKFGHSVAGRCRRMPQNRQAGFMTCLSALSDIFEAPEPLIDVADIIFHLRTFTGRRVDPSAAVPHAPPALSGHSLQPEQSFSPWSGQQTSSSSSFPPSSNVPSASSSSYPASSYSSNLPPLQIHPPSSSSYMAPTTTSSPVPSSCPQLSPPRYDTFH